MRDPIFITADAVPVFINTAELEALRRQLSLVPLSTDQDAADQALLDALLNRARKAGHRV